jgi:hypothetical protein
MKRRFGTGLAVALVLATACLFHGRIALEPGGGRLGFNYDRGLQDLQAWAFVQGRLDIDLPAPPPGLPVKDYRDPAVYAAYSHLWDTSPHNGKVYLYFGPAPVLTFHIPYFLVTGVFPPNGLAILCFVAGALVVLTLLLLRFQRACGIEPTGWTIVPPLALLGFSSMTAVLAHRPFIYELCVASALFWASVAAYFVFDALQAGGRRHVLSFGLASAAYGLAIASRFSYLYGAVFLLPALVIAARRAASPRPWPAVAAASLPLAATGLLLATYNALRFGSPTEFGWRYQVGWDAVSMFAADRILPNLYFYVAHPPRFDAGTLSLGFDTNYAPALWHSGTQEAFQVVGWAVALPALLFCVAMGTATMFSASARPLRGRIVDLVVCLLPGAANFVLLLFYPHVSMRYMADFVPMLAVLGGAGWMLLEAQMNDARPAARIALRMAFVLLLAISAVIHENIALAYGG